MINGRTELIAHLGFPTETFTAPMIYNPWFASRGINAVVVPMGARAEDYAEGPSGDEPSHRTADAGAGYYGRG